MPSNFNGIEIDRAFFNGTELDLIYMNGVEVYSSVVSYLLNLDAVSKDTVKLNGTSWNVPSGVDYSISVKVHTADLTGLAANIVLMGKGGGSGFFIRVDTSGRITFVYNGTSNFTSESGILTDDYPNQIVTITCWFRANDDKEIYVNNDLRRSINDVNTPSTAVNPFYIGSFNGAFNFYTGRIYEFAVDGETWLCNEGSGFNVTSNLSTIGVGQTINAGGLTYWDSTVWSLA